MTTQATPDTVTLLRRWCAVNPTDVTARLILAEAIQEAGDERGAILQRIVARPDDDTRRLDLASLYEATGDPARSEFVRAQVELERIAPRDPIAAAVASEECYQCVCRRLKRQHTNGPCRCTNNYRTFQRRERELLAANEARWRAAGKCEVCKGQGRLWSRDHGGFSCEACHGTGDAGGLTQRANYPNTGASVNDWRHPVHFSRGVIERVDCTLSECGSVEQNKRGVLRSRWLPSPWATAVLRGHATVRELWVTDREPMASGEAADGVGGPDWIWVIRPDEDNLMPVEDSPHFLPRLLWDQLEGYLTNVSARVRAKRYPTAALARAALAVALATLTRAAVEGE